jgi:HlyD family secretion protein
MNKRNVFIVLAIVLIAGAVVGANFYFKREKPLSVTTEAIKTRDLDAIVSASGTIQPKQTVNISADTMGRVVNLAVNEGDRVKRGQFLLQIDPESLKTRVSNGVAMVSQASMSLDQAKQAVNTARVQLDLLQQTLKRQQDLWGKGLTTRETLDKAMNDVKAAESLLQEREHAADAQASVIDQTKANLASAKYDLSKVRIESPIDGIVTARNIQEGETAVVGTMNNAGTVLLKLADMSVIQAEIQVDETNIPMVRFGQKAKISIDAIPDRTFAGHVTEIGNSPIAAATGATGTQATNFKVVVVIDEPIPDIRPGFTCTADITTAKRPQVVSAPIPAVAVRELIYDASGQVAKEPVTDKRRPATPTAAIAELKPGQTRKETEGVFVVRDNRVVFSPIKVGIAGEKYFEILSGLKDGDQVVTGPYNSVRGMAEGDLVKIDNAPKR